MELASSKAIVSKVFKYYILAEVDRILISKGTGGVAEARLQLNKCHGLKGLSGLFLLLIYILACMFIYLQAFSP